MSIHVCVWREREGGGAGMHAYTHRGYTNYGDTGYGDTYFGSTDYYSVFIGHADIQAQSEVMQGWVVGTLDAIPEESIAHATLSRIITAETDERRFNLIDLALFLNMKRVLSQRYVQARGT